jgi:predicted dehydrogenase
LSGARSGPVGVAVIGAGNISGQYLGNLTKFPDVQVLAVADIDEARAAQAAAEYGIEASGSPEAVFEIPEVEIVVNLTIPAAHAQVALAALRAGKHVYGEKPLALDVASGRAVLAEAAERGLKVGNAPDTFLGAGIQSALRAVAAGVIGEPVAATSALESMGPESWHPNPEFFYVEGAGPLFDMGPYYLTALVALLGPVSSVAATGRKARTTRVVGSGPKAGNEFPVEVPTHVTALLEFAEGYGRDARPSASTPPRPSACSSSAAPRRRWRCPTRTPSAARCWCANRRTRTGASCRSRAPRPAAASASWTWPARCGRARSTARRASSACTCWTSWRRSRGRRATARSRR